ncbi:Histidine kinase-, DNA gyrase B-, and HSP90-like ATPase [Rhizobiales bacterium GAS113]|nr:Histidine kinase-, DNA gyrase B-, and HSP90-like ATPase [Rhizobiales bacterium GAS113]
MPEGKLPSLISTLPPSRTQERAALAVALLLLALFFGVLPFAHVRLAQLDVFLPIAATIMFLNDSITASLLYAHFAVLRSRALLVLASGYLFTALIVVCYALTFPGAFAPAGLLGAGLQTPGWLFGVWHMGLPTTIIAYVLLRVAPARMQLIRGAAPIVILASIAVVIVLVCGVTWFVTVHEDMLPALVLNITDQAGTVHIVSAVMLTLCATAFVLLLFFRRSMLDLWLLLVSLGWLLSSILINLVGYRFDVAWYANRIFAIASAGFVLFVLLAESTMLYARLALAFLAQQREREGRLMSMDAMSAAIAHEIKQPLGAIVANAGAGLRWLTRTPPSFDRLRDTFNYISADGHRASEVIQAVRAMFAQDEQVRSTLDANELVRETVSIVGGELDAARIAVQLELAAELPLVSAHRGQLQQVILNLVTNAGDAMRAAADRARVLKMKSETVDLDHIAILVEDTGPGIDPKNLERVFEAFYTTKSRGTGMGLAICRSIVEAHGGTLSVSPAAPHGSVFRMTLPCNAYTAVDTVEKMRIEGVAHR